MSKPPSNAKQIPLYSIAIPAPGKEPAIPTPAQHPKKEATAGVCHECGEHGKYTCVATSKAGEQRTLCGKCLSYYSIEAKYASWSQGPFKKNY